MALLCLPLIRHFPSTVTSLTALFFSALMLLNCAHPAERALQGRWYGKSVENFEENTIAAATGWARGTSFEFKGRQLRVTVPAQKTRTGVYELTAIQNRKVKLTVLGTQGEHSEMDLIVDDAESLRWDLGEGRTLVLKKQP